MATYTKITKDISTYTKIDTMDGWLVRGWLTLGWLIGSDYIKTEKDISTYTKINK